MFDQKFLGVGTVGERGQVAIPTDARKQLQIESGEKLAFFSFGKEAGFLAIKTEKLSAMLEHLTTKSKMFEQIINETKKN